MVTVSWMILTVLVVTGSAEVTLRLLQLATALRRRGDDLRRAVESDESAFVSVHVPTCNEPPALVIATLECLARSRDVQFEVIVVSNNTVDPAIWQPLQAAVSRLGPRFRFLHVERVAGAKAGALNLALAATDPAATHVAIVDCDYQVDPDFLHDALAAAETTGADYVQLPQAYRGVGRAARGVERELHDYFACFAASAGRVGAMLPTGTLSLFRVGALRGVGGWPCATITEDAEIGLALQRAGYRGAWLDRERGRGLLPLDLVGIRKQRARWSAGNAQVLRQLCLGGLQPRRAVLPDFAMLLTQLTAWVTLALPATAALALVMLAPHIPLAGLIGDVSALTLLVSALLTAVRLVGTGNHGTPLRVGIEALIARAAVSWTLTTAWIPALLPVRLRFHRTAKSPDAAVDDDIATLIVSGLFLVFGAMAAMRGQWLAMAACLLLTAAWPCGRFVDAALRRAAAANPELV